MASATTPIQTHASHAVIYEFRVRCLYGGVAYVTYLHVDITRDGAWDVGQPAPTFFEVIDALWDEWWKVWMEHHTVGFTLASLRLSEVTDFELVGGGPRAIYGAFHEMTDFTGLAGPIVGQTSGTHPVMPSFVSIYCLKQKDASPRNINGSLRLGPVVEAWTDHLTDNRLNASAQATWQTAVNDLLNVRAVTAADGGNIVDCQMVIMQRTIAVGGADPWNHVAIPDRIRVRFGLGSQKTRQRSANTYT